MSSFYVHPRLRQYGIFIFVLVLSILVMLHMCILRITIYKQNLLMRVSWHFHLLIDMEEFTFSACDMY